MHVDTQKVFAKLLYRHFKTLTQGVFILNSVFYIQYYLQL